MSIEDVLKGYTAVENEDSDGFEILKGTYKCGVTRLALGSTKMEPKKPRYELELTVNEVLEGNGAAGRRLWRNYIKEDDEAVKKLLNDLFTMGIDIPRKTPEEFEGSFFAAMDHEATIRTWGWTPEKKQDGTPIPEAERVPVQQFKIVNAKKVKTKPKKESDIPF